MSLRHGVMRGAFSLGSARMTVSLLNALGLLVLARLLTPEDFGIVAIATAVMSVIVSITEASLQAALVQCREPTRDHVDTVWTMSFIRAVLILVVLGALAWPLSILYGDERLLGVFLVAGVTGAFMGFYNPLITLATRDLQFRPLVVFQIAQKVFGLSIAVGFALAFGNFWAIIIGNALGAIIASFGSYFFLPYRPRFTLSRGREIWGFSGWMFLNQLCETINWRFDQLAIGLSVSKAQLGFYSVADNLAVIPSRELSMPLRSALFPGLSRLADQRERLRSAFVDAQSGVALVTAPAAIGLALVAEPAVLVLLGEKWLVATPIIQLLAIGYAIDTLITVVHPLGMAMGQTKQLFLRQLLALFFRIPLILGGLMLGGIIGAAAGRALSSVANCAISFLIAKRLVGVSVWQQLRGHSIAFAGLLAMALALLAASTGLSGALDATPLLKLLVLSALGALSYSMTVLFIWTLGGRRHGPVAEVLGVAARIPGFSAFGRLARSA